MTKAGNDPTTGDRAVAPEILTAGRTPTTRRGLMGAALAGVVVGGATPFMLPDSPDAEIIARAGRFIVLQGEYSRLSLATDWCPPDLEKTADMRALEAEFELVCAEETVLLDWLVESSARTVDGIRQKARAALAWEGSDMQPDLLYSVLDDLAGGHAA